MDTSDQYIKMCEKAEEIQSGWKPDFGDIVNKFSLVVKIRLNDLEIVYPGGGGFITKGLCIWLPRQEQLQEMIYKITDNFSQDNIRYGITYVACPDCIVKDLSTFSEEDCSLNLKSMEQLWLAFVMKEKFNKVWNGEDWVTL